jgi:hypothetical protein
MSGAYDLGRFAESALFVRHYPEQNPVLRDLLPTITTPTQIVAGRDDDLVPWSNNQYLDDLLPNSEIHPLGAGHFAREQQRTNTAASSPTGSAADIGASQEANCEAWTPEEWGRQDALLRVAGVRARESRRRGA